MAIRYNLPIRNLPINCVCGTAYSVDHAMSCKRGGYVSQRHDGIRNLFAEKLQNVCHDLCIEPPLQPLNGESLAYLTANNSDAARPEIQGTNFWQQCVRTFIHANCPS